MIVEYDNARVLVTDMKIENIKEIIPILEQVSRINQPLIIIAEDVSGESSDFNCCQIRTDNHGSRGPADNGNSPNGRSSVDIKNGCMYRLEEEAFE